MSVRRSWLMERLSSFGDRRAVTHAGATETYGDLAVRARATKATFERRGIVPGNVVALVGDYSVRSIAALLALHAGRCTAVPIVAAADEEVRTRLDEGQVDWVVGFDADEVRIVEGPCLGREKHPLLQEVGRAGGAGLILFSSGSTGKPKAMVHDFDGLVDRFAERRPKQINILVFLMFDHIGGLNTLLGALATGSHVVVPDSRDPEVVCALMERHVVHVLPASPTFLNLMLMSGSAEKHALGALRLVTYGTEPMPDALLSRLRSAFPRVRFQQTFGTSETGIAQTTSRSSDSTYFRIEDPDLEYQITDGELWLRSKTQIRGYLNASMEAFTPEGWFRTGDLVVTGGDGLMKIVGRLSEMINVGGEKVLPAEVEDALLEVPHVTDCSVYGAPSAITGQTVVADVVLDHPIEPRALRMAIRQHLKGRLAPYKTPTRIGVVDKTFGNRFKKRRGPAGRA